MRQRSCFTTASHSGVKVTSLTLLLLCIVYEVQCSCDGIFSYKRREGNVWGSMQISPPSFYQGGNFVIELTMKVNTLLTQKQQMGIELDGSANDADRALREGRAVSYSVRLPSQQPLPIATEISINGRSICQHDPGFRGSVTTLKLQHTLQLQSWSGGAQPLYTGPKYMELAVSSPRVKGNCDQYYTVIRPGQQARIQVQPPSQRSPVDAIRTQAFFTVTRILDKQQIGSFSLEESKETVANRLRDGRSDSIKYIYTMASGVNPQLIGLQVNNQDVCRDSRDFFRGAYTNFSLSHILYPSVQSGVSTHQKQPTNIPQLPLPVFVQTPAVPNEGDCGEQGVNLNQLVRLGVDVRPGAWPWVAALYVRRASGARLQCGASLVTLRHVITAAHCVYYLDTQLTPSDINIVLGMHILDDFSPPVQTKQVSKIMIHPNYSNPFPNFNDHKYDTDIAVIEFDYPATRSPRVKPICAWGPDTNLVGFSGTVVGWGMDENGITVTMVPRAAQQAIVSSTTCRNTHSQFQMGITENNFCAGNRDGRGPCNGDSGGGLYFLESRSNGARRWVLRGVVSFSVLDENKACDLTHFVAYTNVARASSWISRHIY